MRHNHIRPEASVAMPKSAARSKSRSTPRAGAVPDRAVPLHLQVFIQLRDAIFRGDLSEGTRMPGDVALGEHFNVSRITIRRALDELAARGLVERVQGRGTTVRHRSG